MNNKMQTGKTRIACFSKYKVKKQKIKEKLTGKTGIAGFSAFTTLSLSAGLALWPGGTHSAHYSCMYVCICVYVCVYSLA